MTISFSLSRNTYLKRVVMGYPSGILSLMNGIIPEKRMTELALLVKKELQSANCILYN